MRFPLCCWLSFQCFCLRFSFADAQPYQANERTLLLDHLDDTFTPDGTVVTKPAVIKAAGDLTGGRIMKGPEFVTRQIWQRPAVSRAFQNGLSGCGQH